MAMYGLFWLRRRRSGWCACGLVEMINKIKRPALRYYGGKWKIASWVISHFPDHINYVEPCGGAASILIAKEPAALETYNDIDGRVVNFFRVLRSDPAALIEQIRLTPWSRAEFDFSKETDSNPIEDARRFFVTCWQSFSKHGGSWRSMYDYLVRPRSAAKDIQEIDHLYLIASRLKSVQFECRDAIEIIQKYDTENGLIYFDPPYIPEVRVNKDYYAHEVDTQWHISAADVLKTAKAHVVVSGYRSELYANLFESSGWIRRDVATVANAGAKRTESIWLSPSIQAEKKRQYQMNLF